MERSQPSRFSSIRSFTVDWTGCAVSHPLPAVELMGMHIWTRLFPLQERLCSSPEKHRSVRWKQVLVWVNIAQKLLAKSNENVRMSVNDGSEKMNQLPVILERTDIGSPRLSCDGECAVIGTVNSWIQRAVIWTKGQECVSHWVTGWSLCLWLVTEWLHKNPQTYWVWLKHIFC